MSDFLAVMFLTIFIAGVLMMIGGFGWMIVTALTGAELIFALGLYLVFASTALGILFQQMGLIDD